MEQANYERTLSKYLEKRSLWFSWYDSSQEDANTIQHQIHTMLFSEISARVFIEERKHLQKNDIALTPIFTILLESGYLYSQVFAIRRLFDTRKDVISLSRALSDVKKHKRLITRQTFVCSDGTPYDAPFPQTYISGMQAQDSPFSVHLRCVHRHERFDRLSRVAQHERSHSDEIHPDVFATLEAWLDQTAANRLIESCNKYLAHAADSNSRHGIEQTGLKFSEIEAVQKAVIRVACALFDIILCSGVYSEVVPHTPLGFFGTVWDGSMLIERTTRMNDHWKKMAEVRNNWQHDIESDLCR